MSHQRTTRFDLSKLPEGALLQSVTAQPADIAGRPALRVALEETVARDGRPGVDYVDQPTFVRVPTDFRDGTLEVDILSRLTATAPPDARAFAGLAYRITGGDTFEAVYLRPLNGLKTNPPSPRDRRAVQYFAYPEYPFDRLRGLYPDGRYEAGAAIGPDQWIHLRLEIRDRTVTVTVDGQRVLTLTATKAAPATGDVGLFVDIGTEAYFRDLTITTTWPETPTG